jgi:hypothetical protein
MTTVELVAGFALGGFLIGVGMFLGAWITWLELRR